MDGKFVASDMHKFGKKLQDSISEVLFESFKKNDVTKLKGFVCVVMFENPDKNYESEESLISTNMWGYNSHNLKIVMAETVNAITNTITGK